MCKPLRRAQPAKKEGAQAYGTRVGCAARVCTFLFEILRVNRVLSVQIAAHWEQLHTCMTSLIRELAQGADRIRSHIKPTFDDLTVLN